MTKDEDFKLPKLQTCDLRVNIYCDGCRLKVKKLLHKIEGVFQVAIGLDNQKVTVVGSVDSAILIKKLARAGKHAELWSQKANPSPKSKKENYDIDDCFRGEDYDAAEIQFRANLDLLRQRATEANNAKKHHSIPRISGPATRNGNMNDNINNRPGNGNKIDTNQPMAINNTPSGIEQKTLEALRKNNAQQVDTGRGSINRREPKRVNNNDLNSLMNMAEFNIGNLLNSSNTSQGGLHLQQKNNGHGYQPSSALGFTTETGQYYQQQSTSINGYNNQYYECNYPDFSFLVLIVFFIFIALFVLKF